MGLLARIARIICVQVVVILAHNVDLEIGSKMITGKRMSYLDDPRVYFAAERTLLAWQRSAVAFIALGFVVERFGLFMR
jgi:Domain of unknown function (DUF202)